jgi:ribosomal protein S18 acetylase RimI-like enzyme
VIGDVEIREAGAKGLGVYARRPFVAGEFIFRRRYGRQVSAAGIDSLPEEARRHICELGFDTFAVLEPPGCYLNHACDPNAMRHGVVVFAWRDIQLGEEITVNYRLNAFDDSIFECCCGSANCTGAVVNSFFGMTDARQRRYLPHAPGFIRKEWRERQRDRRREPLVAETLHTIVAGGAAALFVDDLTGRDLVHLGWSGSEAHLLSVAGELVRVPSGEVEYLAVRSPSARPVAKGGIDYAKVGGAAVVYQLATHPALQGHGIGGLLLSVIEERIRCKGLDTAALGVEISNERARALYERLGYEACGRRTESWDAEDAGGLPYRHVADLVLMLKSL